MSGDSHPNDDADFLDEDFVVEDLGGKNDDLEDLFDEPAGKQDAAIDDEDGADDPDADDLLFTDHTEGLEASEEFEGREAFAEDGEARWSGDALDLEDAVASDDTGASGDAVGDDEAEDPVFDEAKETFAQELDSMLSEEDFAIDSENELELVDNGDGISEFEQSGPFVLDDGDGLWADDDALEGDAVSEEQQAIDDEVPYAEGLIEDDEATEVEPLLADDALDAVELPLRGTSTDDVAGDEAGWEPLPPTSVDALSEVDEVQRTADDVAAYADEDYDLADHEDDEYDLAGYEDDDGVYAHDEEAAADATVPSAHEDQDLEDVDGHDIYAEDEDDEAVVVGGAIHRRSRLWGTLLSVAATLLVMGGAAAVVLRPEWFGLRFEPERVERVEIDRPRIEVAVAEPPKPAESTPPTDERVGQADPSPSVEQGADPVIDNAPAGGGGEVVAGAGQETGAPTGQTPAEGPSDVEDPPSAVDPQPITPVADSQPIDAQPVDPVVAEVPPSTDAQPVREPEVVTSPSEQAAWPVEAVPQQPQVAQAPRGAQLSRFGDGLMVGELAPGDERAGQAVDGVLPGSRAFAQLANGNYFIGSVKQIAPTTITLRVESGEVTLRTEEIVQLTQLGSSDFEELQNATKGFVRLTNNNRLVGGILSRIADDHIVLEFRKNRVMLPKSAIGEIVSGEAEGSTVRIDTTSEEDNWLRKIAERELGTGRGAEVVPDGLPPGPQRSGPPR